MSTPVTRLFRYPVTLVTRTQTQDEDEWGSPIVTESTRDTVCYYRQTEQSDEDTGGESPMAQVEVFLAPTEDVDNLDAVELDFGQGKIRMEVIGQPARELNARTGGINHLRFVVRRELP